MCPRVLIHAPGPIPGVGLRLCAWRPGLTASGLRWRLDMTDPSPWLMIPFGVLLTLIALAPLCFAGWWGRHYPKVAIGLAIVVVACYLSAGGGHRVTEVGFDYARFIILIGSLFVVAGGIHISVKGEATPRENVLFLLIGALVANLLGTTGASMLLIRPWIRMNKYRVTGHHIVFFIFVVSNVGGCLTPVGDPPLYLGYLKGIPFWWVTRHCLLPWACGVGILLAMFYAVDSRNYLRAPKRVRSALAEPHDHWRFEGTWNLGFLALILVAAFVERPAFLREVLMIAAALGSWFTTPKSIHHANDFNLHPLKEVAILFVGIFATMMPALDWLQTHAGRFGTLTPSFFYFGSGSLSSVLDNAPTYLAFLNTIFGASVDHETVRQVLQSVASHPPGAGPGVSSPAVQNTLAALQQYYSCLLYTSPSPRDS